MSTNIPKVFYTDKYHQSFTSRGGTLTPPFGGILIPYCFSSRNLMMKNYSNFPGFPVDNSG